jgi:hypothetical protein
VPGLSAEALTFYENGLKTRAYNVGDLMAKDQKFVPILEGYYWLKGYAFDDESNILSVTTMDDDRFSFDITSGGIIRIERNPRKLLVALLIGTSLLLLIITLFIIAKRH